MFGRRCECHRTSNLILAGLKTENYWPRHSPSKFSSASSRRTRDTKKKDSIVSLSKKFHKHFIAASLNELLMKRKNRWSKPSDIRDEIGATNKFSKR